MEEKALATTDSGPLKARDIRAQVNLVQEVMKSVMKVNIHYGIIPGCKKPSLWKPGAEKLLMTFRLVADNPEIVDLSTSDRIRYRVTQRILNLRGDLIGAASGECSSDEDKYRWRRPICDKEFEETPEDQRMEKWIKGMNGPVKIKRIRTVPADFGNTILKMAIKRALVATTLVCTAASDVFDQDIEDLPPELIDEEHPNGSGKPAVEIPKEKLATTSPATHGPHEPGPGELACMGCGVGITQAEKEYSEKKFKKSLCRNCQRDESSRG